jgi:hypothetical protein
MFNIGSTVIVVVGFATLGEYILLLDEILLDFWKSYAEE